MSRLLVSSLAVLGVASAQYSAYYHPSANGLPDKTENGQTGTNKCGTESSQTSQCQNVYVDSIDDFCVFGPPNGGEVAANEAVEVSYCTKAGRGTRVLPEGTITGAHFVRTPSYVQVTGEGDFTKIGISPGDQGGELDPHGADGTGNPKGGLVFVNGVQSHEWFNFMGATDFCIRACFDGNRATSLCRHTYDELGCGFNAPGNYATNVFESCEGDDAQDIMYGYPGLGTFVQTDTSNGVAVPSPHPAPASSNCQNVNSAQLGGTATNFGRNAQTSAPTSSASSSSTSSTTLSSTSSSTSSTSSSSSSTSTVIAVQMTTSLTSSSPVSTVVQTTSKSGPTATVSSGRSAQDATAGASSLALSTLGAATIVSFVVAISLFS